MFAKFKKKMSKKNKDNNKVDKFSSSSDLSTLVSENTDDLDGICNIQSSCSYDTLAEDTLTDDKIEVLNVEGIEQGAKSISLDKQSSFSSVFVNLDNEDSNMTVIIPKKSKMEKFIDSDDYRRLDVLRRCAILELCKSQKNLMKIEEEYFPLFGFGWQQMLPKDLEGEYYSYLEVSSLYRSRLNSDLHHLKKDAKKIEDEYLSLFGSDSRENLNKHTEYNSFLNTIMFYNSIL
ncbi:MAG: hypothetical protein KFW09_04740 [Oscillospiraceae bacterium]|nr:hypothetical protein [Oscillospiraceae bacterium]